MFLHQPPLQICTNKYEFSDFWASSYCFVQIVMLIRIQFWIFIDYNIIAIWEGHFLIILKKGRGSSSLRCLFTTSHNREVLAWRAACLSRRALCTGSQPAAEVLPVLYWSGSCLSGWVLLRTRKMRRSRRRPNGEERSREEDAAEDNKSINGLHKNRPF